MRRRRDTPRTTRTDASSKLKTNGAAADPRSCSDKTSRAAGAAYPSRGVGTQPPATAAQSPRAQHTPTHGAQATYCTCVLLITTARDDTLLEQVDEVVQSRMHSSSSPHRSVETYADYSGWSINATRPDVRFASSAPSAAAPFARTRKVMTPPSPESLYTSSMRST